MFLQGASHGVRQSQLTEGSVITITKEPHDRGAKSTTLLATVKASEKQQHT